MKTLYKIRERRKMQVQPNHADAEFGRVHPVQKSWEVETYDLPPKVVAERRSFSAAENWITKNGGVVHEVCS